MGYFQGRTVVHGVMADKVSNDEGRGRHGVGGGDQKSTTSQGDGKSRSEDVWEQENVGKI